MRRIMFAAIAALAFATAAGAAGPGAVSGPYTMDASGKCHDASGKFTKQANCAPAPNCKPGKSKPCGHSCITLDKVCHI
jgi:hypothetical protein